MQTNELNDRIDTFLDRKYRQYPDLADDGRANHH